MRRLAASVLIAIAVSAMAQTARAEAEHFGALVVADFWAAPAAQGASTRLYMTVSNDGQDDVHLISVTTPVSRSTKWMYAPAPGRSMPLESVAVRADQTVSFTDGGMWIELCDLQRDLADGGRIPVTLHFADGSQMDISVPVGRGQGGGQDRARVPPRGAPPPADLDHLT